MPLYSIDVKICGTVYIKAKSKKEARKKLKKHHDSAIYSTNEGTIGDIYGDSIPFSGAHFDSPGLPEISLSPAMTFYGPWPKSEFDLADE